MAGRFSDVKLLSVSDGQFPTGEADSLALNSSYCRSFGRLDLKRRVLGGGGGGGGGTGGGRGDHVR